MSDIVAYTIELIGRIRRQSPLIHNITNFVVMNSSANILLAIGASPVMAHSRDEVQEMAAIAGALVLNIGTLDAEWIESMHIAGRQANAKGIPIVLDPVGAGATAFRTEKIKEILKNCRVSVLRGNVSEVLSLASADIRTRGVDSTLKLNQGGISAAAAMAKEMRCVVAISGERDCITDGRRLARVGNGQPLMTRVTGIGCGLSAVTAAFCAVAEDDPYMATVAAFAFYGLCADLAIRVSDLPGSFFTAFLDCLYRTGSEEIAKGLDVSLYSPS